MPNVHSYTEPVWLAMCKSAEHTSDHVSMSWALEHDEHTLLATPTISNVGYMAAVKTTVTDNLSKMHLHATLKCMSSYLLAFTLLIGQAAKILLMAIWMSLAMYATALQTTRPGTGTNRHQIRTPWLAQTTQCIAYMLWVLLMILRHAASNVHIVAAICSAITFTKTQHALIMYILIIQVTCAIMQLIPVIMFAVQQTVQLMMPSNRRHRKFAHPKLRGSRFWRHIRYIQRRYKGQPLYKLLTLLLQVRKKLHQFHSWKECMTAPTSTAMNAEPKRQHTDREQTARTCNNVLLERNLFCTNTDYKRGTYQKASCKDNAEHDNPCA